MDEPLSRRKFWFSLSGLLTVSALAALDNFIINPALPQIVGEFGAMAQLSWVVTAFMLASTVTMPLYGKFSDIYGRRQLFVVSIVIFLIGSALCGLAQSMTQLIAFRAVQGLGAGGVGVLARTTLADLVSPRDRPRYQGLFNATFALANIAGPVVGGIVTEYFGWRWVFYVNIPVGLLALVLITATLPKRLSQPKQHEIDYAGVGLLLVGTVSFLYALGLVEADASLLTATFIGVLVLFLASFALLFRNEKRVAEPILAVDMMSNRVFTQVVAASTLIGLAYFGSSVYLPLFFQLVGGLSVAGSGLMLLPHLLASTTMSLVFGQVVSRTGRYKPPILIGMGLVAAALLGLAVTTYLELGRVAWICCLVTMGTGGGLCMPNLTVALQNAIPSNKLGAGTSTMQFCNQLAAVAGVAISGLLLSQRFRAGAAEVLPADIAGEAINSGVQLLASITPDQREAVILIYEHAFTFTFLASSCIAVLALLVATTIPALELRTSLHSPEPQVPGAAQG